MAKYDNYADAVEAYNERLLQEYLDKDDEEEEKEEKDWVLEAILKEQKKSSK